VAVLAAGVSGTAVSVPPASLHAANSSINKAAIIHRFITSPRGMAKTHYTAAQFYDKLHQLNQYSKANANAMSKMPPQPILNSVAVSLKAMRPITSSTNNVPAIMSSCVHSPAEMPAICSIIYLP
jgi:hypothetical protein